jgi:hypothetical protein
MSDQTARTQFLISTKRLMCFLLREQLLLPELQIGNPAISNADRLIVAIVDPAEVAQRQMHVRASGPSFCRRPEVPGMLC